MDAIEIFNVKIEEILNRYSGDQHAGTQIRAILGKSKDSEIIIPFLGMQGVGKSTLMNSVLGENILPNTAGETTCVPVEVHYGTESKGFVYYKDSDRKDYANTLQELTPYVDNELNPGNEKQILKVVIYRNLELLRNGLILVDLPGTWSLNTVNQETTERYINNLSSAVFVFSTYRPLDALEMQFIKLYWPLFLSVIFVQTRWGECQEDVEESLTYNKASLNNAAQKIKQSFDGKVIVVSSKEAMNAVLDKDEEKIDKSNIQELIDSLYDLGNNWAEKQKNGALVLLKGFIESCIQTINDKLIELKRSDEENKKIKEAQLKECEAITSSMKKKAEEAKKLVSKLSDDFYHKTKTEATQCVSRIRERTYSIIDDGIVDGNDLTEAFTDIQREETTEFFNTVYEQLLEAKITIDESYTELQIELSKSFSFDTFNFSTEEAVKFEKAIPYIFDIGGAVAGFAAGGAVTAALAGTAETSGIIAAVASGGTAGSAAGPIGVLVGIGVGIVIGIIGSLSKKATREARGTKAKQQISPVIDQIEDVLKKYITERADAYFNKIPKAIDHIIEEQNQSEKSIRAKLNEKTDPKQEKQLNEDLVYLQGKVSLLSGAKDVQ